MKKIICLFLIVLIFVSNSYVLADDNILGDVVKTDIVAYINNYPISSCNINGTTAILVEELKNYGFEVVWNGDERAVEVSKNNVFNIEPQLLLYRESFKQSGKFQTNYYKTDIKTYLDGELIESFNIGGKTAIYLNSLKKYGTINWSEEKREAYVDIENLSQNEYYGLYVKYDFECDAPMLENAGIGDYLNFNIDENGYNYSYDITNILLNNFSDYSEILKKCGYYYMEEKSSNSDSMYFTDEATIIRIYISGEHLFVNLTRY